MKTTEAYDVVAKTIARLWADVEEGYEGRERVVQHTLLAVLRERLVAVLCEDDPDFHTEAFRALCAGVTNLSGIRKEVR